MKKIYRTVVLILISIIVFSSVFGGTIAFYYLKMQNYQILREAKNAELAMSLLALDFYSKDQHIYNPLTPDGLAEGVAEEVRELSGAEGTLILGSWDAARQAPRSFTYITGKIVVVYDYDEQEESRWKLCYQFKEAAKPER